MTDDERGDGNPTELPETEGAKPVVPPARRIETLPASIGGYRIHSKLGEGGMGVVYEAEQASPRRKVAVKVVRGGQFVDERHLRMFQREAETLARLKHPNIGAIYESGRTEDGQHFFAMELVRGQTLDRYLKNRPDVSSRAELHRRLRLFRKIGDAVHYAHQRGVIHRDLKPSNIVVTEERAREEEIKILDFGLARITEGDIATATLSTKAGDIKGTLAYMSPEQARGKPDEIDVRTDVYALGMILYEMLSGVRPYDVMHKALAEAVRVICEVPPRSLKQTISGIRRIDPDIETIVGKALEKEAERRYPSAAALSEDVGRYLTSQPILARPPSTIYQLGRFARRNRILVGGIGATFIVLVAGIVVSTTFGIREAAQRREAERAMDDLVTVVDFQAGMLDDLQPDQMGQRLIANLQERVADAARRRGASDSGVESSVASFRNAMREVNATNAALQVVDEDILGRAGRTINDRFSDRPLIAARLEAVIGETYRRLGLYQKSEPHVTRAVEIRQRELGADHPLTLGSRSTLAILCENQGRYAEAEKLKLEVLEARKRVLGSEHTETLAAMNNLAVLFWKQRRYAEAESLYKETLEGHRRVLGNTHRETLISMNNLAASYHAQNKYDLAETLYLETLEIRRRLLGKDHPETLESVNNLAALYDSQKRFSEASPLYLETLAARRRVLGDEHPSTVGSMVNLATSYAHQQQYAEAEPLFVRAIELEKRVLGAEHPTLQTTVLRLASMYWTQGRHSEVEPLYLEVFDIRRRTLGLAHRDTLRVLTKLIDVYRATSRTDEVRRLVTLLLAGRKEAAEKPGADARSKNSYAWNLLTCEPADLRDPPTALRFALEAGELSNFEDPNILDTLSFAYHRTGDTAKAIENQKKAVELLPEDSPARASLDENLAEFEAALAKGK